MSGGPRDLSPTGERIPAFVNAKAGSAASVRDALSRDARFDPREVAPDEIPDLIRAAATLAGEGGGGGGPRRVLVCGGDGTIAAAVGAAMGTALELGVLPAGTLNHFARDYGLPVDPAEALEVAATGSSELIDVGVVNGRVMVNTASVGAYVDFVRHRESRERYLGYHVASLIAAISVWLRPRWVEVGLRATEGERQSFRTPLLFVGVGEREFGRGGLGKRRPSPDGARALHVVVVDERRRPRIAALVFGALLRGGDEFLRLEAIESYLVPEADVVLRHRLATIAVDGELVAMETPLHFELKTDAVRLVRSGSPAS
jgi:diacylglycerol kinase family enzyme